MGRLVCAAAMAFCATGCVYLPGEPYVSKMSLGLNVPAISDGMVRARAVDAQPDIERTLRVLADGRIDREEAQRQLGWNANTPLQLPPERRDSASAGDAVLKRWPMAFMKAEDWTAPDESTVSFTAVFGDSNPAREVRERQTYRLEGKRWNLSEQKRLR